MNGIVNVFRRKPIGNTCVIDVKSHVLDEFRRLMYLSPICMIAKVQICTEYPVKNHIR